MNYRYTLVLLAAIIILGLALRLYHLAAIPNGFFFDEATISYQAYSLIKTGHDTWGHFLPLLSFRDYGEYILPLGIYGQIPSIFLGGLTVFAARLPHALLGSLTITLVYLLGKNLSGQKVGLLASLFLATSPLSLGWSRFVFEGNFGTVFFLAGAFFFSDYLKIKKHFSWAIFFLGLSMLTYHVFLVLTPTFTVILIFAYRRNMKPSASIRFMSLILTGIFLLWASAAVWSGAGRQRFTQASTLVTPQQVDVSNHEIGYCSKEKPTWLCKLTINKPVMVGTNYLRNYLGHFSPDFLAFDGTFLRRNILPPSGILLLSEALFFIAGTFYLLKNSRVLNLLPLTALLIYPAANSFTGIGEISRVAFAAPFLSLVAAFGLWQISRRYQPLKNLVIPVYLLSLLIFLVNYFTVFPSSGALYVDYGYDQLYRWVRQNYNKYDRFLISNSYSGSVPAISALFFLPVDPNLFTQSNKVVRHPDDKGYFVYDRLDKLYFVGKVNLKKVNLNDFLVVAPEDIPKKQSSPDFVIIEPTGRALLVGIPASRLLND